MIFLWNFIRKVFFSSIFWSFSIIILAILPITLDYVILGLVMTAIPICIILCAKRASIYRAEWLISAFIVLIFCSFFLFLSEAFIYPIVVYGIGFIIACFSFKKQDFAGDKVMCKTHANKDDSLIFAELIPSILLDQTNVSMCFYHDEQYLGTAVPIARYGYNFTFYGKGLQCCNLYNLKTEWKFPFMYPFNTYNLEGDKINLLTVKRISYGKINIEFYNGDSFSIPLYGRNAELLSKYGMRIKFGLYHEGIIIKYDRLMDDQMALSISCLVYFLWLLVYGTKRTDY